MSEQTTTGTAGGFSGDLAQAFNPAPGSGCCGSPATNTGTGSGTPTATGGPCCGTVAEAKAEGACCGTAAKTEAVSTGSCGCN